jgi:tetratricopeptide (TPR) repeat protein
MGGHEMASGEGVRVSVSRLARLLGFLQQDAGNAALRKDVIREACNAGQWEQAHELIEAGLRANPADPDLLVLAGLVHLQARRYEEAEVALSAALAHGVEGAGPRYSLAYARFMQRHFEDALEVLGANEPALQLSAAQTLRARCLHHLGRAAEAIATCTAHLADVPADDETRGVLALLLHDDGKHAEAMDQARRALFGSPQQLEAMLALASAQSATRDFDAAWRSFDALLRVHPDCGRARLGRGSIHLAYMRLESARYDLERAAQLTPDHIGTWHVLAWIHIMARDVAEAHLAFERALAIDRTFAESHGGLAIVAALRGQESDAEAGIKRALRLDSQCLSARYAEMLLFQRRGESKRATAVFADVLARPVEDSGIAYRELLELHVRSLRRGVDEGSAPAPLH